MALRPEIVSSWRRTASAGLDPGATVDPEDVAYYDHGSRLRRAAAPVLDAVAEHLAGTRYGVVLADPDSCIVDARFGQSEFEARLAALGAVPGKTFTEATTGTNSIPTAGETQRGVAVHGEEHYLEVFKRFACFGAPIRDPITRRHAGVPDITCFAEDGAPLLRPFLSSTRSPNTARRVTSRSPICLPATASSAGQASSARCDKRSGTDGPRSHGVL
ncbi:hypothetical protein [Actinomycetospora sp. NBC_00405]|uniref:hypothetical protein n=1 Tax=Actinomycetospora sp. NBC_00405 TaxID=2975952 RepID=UPI002E1B5594